MYLKLAVWLAPSILMTLFAMFYLFTWERQMSDSRMQDHIMKLNTSDSLVFDNSTWLSVIRQEQNALCRRLRIDIVLLIIMAVWVIGSYWYNVYCQFDYDEIYANLSVLQIGLSTFVFLYVFKGLARRMYLLRSIDDYVSLFNRS